MKLQEQIQAPSKCLVFSLRPHSILFWSQAANVGPVHLREGYGHSVFTRVLYKEKPKRIEKRACCEVSRTNTSAIKMSCLQFATSPYILILESSCGCGCRAPEGRIWPFCVHTATLQSKTKTDRKTSALWSFKNKYELEELCESFRSSFGSCN